jgi:hypothetical protein
VSISSCIKFMFLRNLFTFMPMTLFTFLVRHLVQLNTAKGQEGNLYKHLDFMSLELKPRMFFCPDNFYRQFCPETV